MNTMILKFSSRALQLSTVRILCALIIALLTPNTAQAAFFPPGSNPIFGIFIALALAFVIFNYTVIRSIAYFIGVPVTFAGVFMGDSSGEFVLGLIVLVPCVLGTLFSSEDGSPMIALGNRKQKDREETSKPKSHTNTNRIPKPKSHTNTNQASRENYQEAQILDGSKKPTNTKGRADCPRCAQKLRAPARLVKVGCPNCGHVWTHNGTF